MNRFSSCHACRLIRHSLALLCLLAVGPLMALEMSIIPLNNANAEQLVEVIASQLEEGSTVTSYQNQIILNASPEETSRIKTLITTLDAAGRQLRIAVKTGNTGTITTSEGRISSNGVDDGGIRITRNGKLQNTTTTIQRRTTTISGSGHQGIRATEGQPAYITTGSSMAFNQPVMTANGQIVQTQQWQNAQTGFWATAWLNGDTVSINIEQQKQSFNSNASINNQQLQTRVNGRLGEWIAIGTLDSQDASNTHSLNSLGRNTDRQANTIYLKVELAE